LLSAAEQKKVKKNLKEYSKQFDEEDYMEANKASAEIILKRREQWAEYKKLMAKYQDQIMKEKDVRVALYGFDPAEHGKGVII
jgi:translation initiation factor 3 subunit B